MDLLSQVNPDDLDLVLKAIQLMVDQKENDLHIVIHKLLEKYKDYNLQDSDKRLFNRFYFRITELSEKSKNQDVQAIIQNIRDALTQKTANFSVILSKIHKGIEKQEQTQNQESQVLVRKPTQQWQVNGQRNKGLMQFYEDEFWKLYNIMTLHKQYYTTLIVYHQSKEENLERLYQNSLERNQRLIQGLVKYIPKVDLDHLKSVAMKLSTQSQSTMFETPYQNRKMTMFQSSLSPIKKQSNNYSKPYQQQSTSASPQKQRSIDPEFKSMFDTQTTNIFDQNFRMVRNKNYSLHNDKYEGTPNYRKYRVQQENYSPIQSCKNQNWIFPEIKLQNSIDLQPQQKESLIKPILVQYENTQSSRQKQQDKKQIQKIQIFNNTISQYQQFPQYRTNQRAFQTIKSLLKKQ